MNHDSALPPGQQERADFPRFGLTPFAYRFPKEPNLLRLRIVGLVANELDLSAELGQLDRVEQVSDFHCVTTWSHRNLTWSGYRFKDFYSQLVVPLCQPEEPVAMAVMWGQDSYRTSLPLSDLMADEVLLADRLDGQPLSITHGAPLRIVAPAHYGYKNVKHLNRVDFLALGSEYNRAGFRFMDHPRARVAAEERGLGVPGWLLRYAYRPLIKPTVRRFRKAMATVAGDSAAGANESPL